MPKPKVEAEEPPEIEESDLAELEGVAVEETVEISPATDAGSLAEPLRDGIDFAGLYEAWPGLDRRQCRKRCPDPRCCRPGQLLALLPGEGDFLRSQGLPAVGDVLSCEGWQHCYADLRPVCCRTFPVHPDPEGHLRAWVGCSAHGELGADFLLETERAWAHLLRFPEVRSWVAQKWEEVFRFRVSVPARPIAGAGEEVPP